MRQRLRSHLTYANVMATLAVFLVLGGGTALAAYVVSSNSQIGPNTVSGHKPPAGKHANIIAGSIARGDLAPAARGARAYARVSSGGFPVRSKNVASVTHPATGVYCITLGGGIDPASAVLVVSPEAFASGTDPGADHLAHAEWIITGSGDCPTDTLVVLTYLYDGSDLTYSDGSFAFVVP